MNINQQQMRLLEKAILQAVTAHQGQVDKAGLPYILHPLAVMLSLPTEDVEGRIVAVLHDVVEDTSVTLKDLNLWLPGYLVAAVDAMTKREGEKKIDYWTRCKSNEIARRVKIADMKHNSSPERLGCLLSDEAAYLVEKYRKGLAFMQS